MFNFLENDEILKAKRNQKKREYRDALLLQIEENRLRKLNENKKSNNKNILNIKLIENDKSYFEKENKKNIFFHKQINSSIDNINLFHNKKITKLSLNDKLSSLKNLIFIDKNKNRNNNNFSKLRISTEFNENNTNFKSTLFKLNRNKIINTDVNTNLINRNKPSIKKSLSQLLINFSIQRNKIMKNKINSINHNLMNEIDIQFLFKEFVERQIKTINDFAVNLEDIFYLQYKDKINNIKSFNSLIKSEKNKAIQNIENSKDKLKQKFGFFPMEKIYDSRIEQLFNKIINKITSLYSSISLTKIDNYINKSNSNNNIFKNKDFEFFKINKITTNKYIIAKPNELNNNINSSNKKFNIEEDLNFFDFWKNKYEDEIMKEKNNILKVNETIKFDNYWNNKNKENLIIFPANNFLKDVKFRNINKINKQEKENNGIELPFINLKEKSLKKRNFSANHKKSEGLF